MTQGAGQGPAVRTETLRDFRVPAVEPAPYGAPSPVAYEDHAVLPHQHPGPEAAPAPVTAHEQPHEPPHGHPQGRPHPAPHEAPYPGGYEHPHANPYGGPPDPRQEPAGSAPAPAPGFGAAYEDPRPHSHEAAHGEPRPGGAGDSGAPGEYDDSDEPEGYTPTRRDLPVIGARAGDTVQVQHVPADRPGGGPLYVVGDVHGYLDELLTELRAQNLIDADGHWSAGNARLWFLGDFTDRGPDGIGVIDLVMRLSAEAAASGGYCKALMGNHELLLIGAKRFGDTPVSSGAGTATFQAAWLLNGGQRTDMERLEDVHLQWMSRLDAAALEDGHLLLHSDTTAYLDYGDSIEDVNDRVHELLNRNDANETWDLFRKFTKRFAFRDEESGPGAVRELLSTYGGHRIVHGHSPIPYLLGEVGGEDDEGGGGPVVEGPHVYADGLAIAMDGGVTMAGKLLVVQLPLSD
ncbi:metallophosphoesterase [Streptomyces sp. NPDC097619]|uniref:metallophosphoesterase n=1 Tax=Streptomyces sp. NPDC097619 TaxID=3157228 RepID=UPI003323FE6F